MKYLFLWIGGFDLIVIRAFQFVRVPNIKPTCMAIFTSSTDEWGEDDTILMGDSTETLSSQCVDKLESSLNTFASVAAIDTVSYYMLEFRDDVYEGWMKSFCNYSTHGFPKGRWENYIESMIKIDVQSFQITMRPPKALLRGRNSKLGGNVVLKYDVDLEPRKIAHQILTVRENVCEEMIEDLYAIRTENIEAARYATAKLTDGLESAEKSRRVTRSPSSESTPNRGKNFFNLNVLVTNTALQLLRAELDQKNDEASREALESVITQVRTDYNSKDITSQFFSHLFGPRTLIEDLYYRGMVDGAQSLGRNKVNVLNLAKNLLMKRHSLAVEAQKLLRYQNLNHRHYYKMIKECGGFKKLDLKQAKVTILDLDEEQRLWDAKVAAEAKEAAELEARQAVEADAQAKAATATASSTSSSSSCEPASDSTVGGSKEESGNLFDTDFGSFEPMLM